MNAAPENTTPAKENWPGWITAIIVGALVGLSCGGIIAVFLTNMNTRCANLGADPSAGGSRDPLRTNEALSFYCGIVSPGLNIAVWAGILGLVLGAATAAVIGIRGRRDLGGTDPES